MFSAIDTDGDGSFVYGDLTNFLIRTRRWKDNDDDTFRHDHQLLWNCCDHYNSGFVYRKDFCLLGYSFLMHKSPGGALESFMKHEQRYREQAQDLASQTIVSGDNNSVHHLENSSVMDRESRFPRMRESDLEKFQELLR